MRRCGRDRTKKKKNMLKQTKVPGEQVFSTVFCAVGAMTINIILFKHFYVVQHYHEYIQNVIRAYVVGILFL